MIAAYSNLANLSSRFVVLDSEIKNIWAKTIKQNEQLNQMTSIQKNALIEYGSHK